MSVLKFSAIIKIRGVNPYVVVNAAEAAVLKPNWRKPMPVLVRLNGKPKKAWPINMMPDGEGGFYLYLAGVVRKATNTGVGDKVDVEVRFNGAYKNGPMHAMPAWFAAALEDNAVAKNNWDALIPSRKKEVLRYLDALKSDAARERNLVRVMEVLSGKRARFMARDWKDGV